MLFTDSVEVDELNFPIVVKQQRIKPDSEGAGKFRGAPSVLAEYGPLNGQLSVIFSGDGSVNSASGVLGGREGGLSSQAKRGRDGSLTPLPGQARVELAPGETIISITAAGGGYGEPGERDPELVLRDVREGWISPERARDVYRVAVVDGAIDGAATASLRASVGEKEE